MEKLNPLLPKKTRRSYGNITFSQPSPAANNKF